MPFSNWDVLKLMDLLATGWPAAGERVFSHHCKLMPVSEIERCGTSFRGGHNEFSTGRELWFTEGDLHLAIRASCSMPGLMAPVMHNGYWLVDGAVVNPVPVLARAMGADIVIAVDLQHDAHLMQQDLLSMEVPRPESEEDFSWHSRLRTRLARMTSRRRRGRQRRWKSCRRQFRLWKIASSEIVWRATRLIS